MISFFNRQNVQNIIQYIKILFLRVPQKRVKIIYSSFVKMELTRGSLSFFYHVLRLNTWRHPVIYTKYFLETEICIQYS